jgi:hypothetical protein
MNVFWDEFKIVTITKIISLIFALLVNKVTRYYRMETGLIVFRLISLVTVLIPK